MKISQQQIEAEILRRYNMLRASANELPVKKLSRQITALLFDEDWKP